MAGLGTLDRRRGDARRSVRNARRCVREVPDARRLLLRLEVAHDLGDSAELELTFEPESFHFPQTIVIWVLQISFGQCVKER